MIFLKTEDSTRARALGEMRPKMNLLRKTYNYIQLFLTFIKKPSINTIFFRIHRILKIKFIFYVLSGHPVYIIYIRIFSGLRDCSNLNLYHEYQGISVNPD